MPTFIAELKKLAAKKEKKSTMIFVQNGTYVGNIKEKRAI